MSEEDYSIFDEEDIQLEGGIYQLEHKFKNLVNLKILAFGVDNYNEIPKNLNEIPNITELMIDIDNDTEHGIFETRIEDIRTLEKLTIRAYNISDDTIELGNLENLRYLSLNLRSNNSVPNVGDFINLTYLDLSNNRMLTISRDIFDLVNLTELNVSQNVINMIPNAIKKLRKLEKLDISMNALEYISPKIGKLLRLKTLNLSFNFRLKAIPFELYMLKVPDLRYSDTKIRYLLRTEKMLFDSY